MPLVETFLAQNMATVQVWTDAQSQTLSYAMHLLKRKNKTTKQKQKQNKKQNKTKKKKKQRERLYTYSR